MRGAPLDEQLENRFIEAITALPITNHKYPSLYNLS